MSSHIPATLNYFIQLCQATLPADRLVYFGKRLAKYTAPITLQVAGITGDQVVAELGPSYRREETFALHCVLSAFSGDQQYIDRFNDIFNDWSAITIAVANDPALGNNVRYAEVGNMSYLPEATTHGMSIGDLSFDVRCQVRITSAT